jgi:cytochrome c-type biogenesis protein CcmF
MVVHLGVVLVAVAISTSGSYLHESEARYSPGETRTVAGHEITYLSTAKVQERNRLATKVRVRVDGGTPSVKTGIKEDVYLTITRLPDTPGGEVTLRVLIQPMAVWLWIGGGVMAFGTVLAAWPGRRRRRPTDPTSAPAVQDEPGPVGGDEPVAVGVS